MYTLIITLNLPADDALMAFPFCADQFISAEHGDTVEIALHHELDTTTAQEQFLNTNEAVKSFKLRYDVAE